MEVFYFILGRGGLPYQILGQINDPSYIKQFLQSRLGLKPLILHDIKYAKFYWSMDSVISKGIRQNKFITSWNYIWGKTYAFSR